MYVFIDESGIHKQQGKSTTALVYVKVNHIEELDKLVVSTEKNINITYFHWKEQGWKVRYAFLDAILRGEFEVKIFVFANPFTQEKLENAWKHLIVEKDIRNIVIDGHKSRHYTQELKKVLRYFGIRVNKIRLGNDRAYPCLRIADLFAGLVKSHEENPENPDVAKLYSIAKNKITIHLHGWPGAG